MYASLLLAESGNRLLDSMIFPLKTVLGSPASAKPPTNMMRRMDETRSVRRLIVVDGTRSRLEDRPNRVETFSVGSFGSIEAHCDLDSVSRKRAIELSKLWVITKCIKMTLNCRRVATSNGAGQALCRAFRSNIS